MKILRLIPIKMHIFSKSIVTNSTREIWTKLKVGSINFCQRDMKARNRAKNFGLLRKNTRKKLAYNDDSIFLGYFIGPRKFKFIEGTQRLVRDSKISYFWE